MRIIIVIYLLLLGSCQQQQNKLNHKIETLELERIAFACDCADWINVRHFGKEDYEDSAIFIEPADSTLAIPDTLGYNGDIIRFRGQFYENKGYPKNYHFIESLEKARVFRYSSFEVIKSNYSEYTSIENTKDTFFRESTLFDFVDILPKKTYKGSLNGIEIFSKLDTTYFQFDSKAYLIKNSNVTCLLVQKENDNFYYVIAYSGLETDWSYLSDSLVANERNDEIIINSFYTYKDQKLIDTVTITADKKIKIKSPLIPQ